MSTFLSLDIETLGLGLDAPIIQFGAVVADWMKGEILGTFETNLRHDTYDNCEPYAMSMHPKILREIAYGECMAIDNLARRVCEWLRDFGLTNTTLDGPAITVAGKNVAGFDIPRLRHQCRGWDLYVPTRHRVLDPGLLYWDPQEDRCPPTLSKCLERAKLCSNVSHTALADAIDVANLIIAYVQRTNDAPTPPSS